MGFLPFLLKVPFSGLMLSSDPLQLNDVEMDLFEARLFQLSCVVCPSLRAGPNLIDQVLYYLCFLLVF